MVSSTDTGWRQRGRKYPPPPEIYKENMKKELCSQFIVVSCDCISIKYKKLEQLIPHCCIKVTAPERNSRDYGKKHDEFLYKAN